MSAADDLLLTPSSELSAPMGAWSTSVGGAGDAASRLELADVLSPVLSA